MIKKYRKCSFVFDDAIEFYHGVPAVLVLTQRNAGCKTWNNDHHALYMVSETACHDFPFTIDYINLWLTLDFALILVYSRITIILWVLTLFWNRLLAQSDDAIVNHCVCIQMTNIRSDTTNTQNNGFTDLFIKLLFLFL